MLLFNGKGVAHFKKRGTGVAEDTESVDERFTKWTVLNCFLSSGRRGAYSF